MSKELMNGKDFTSEFDPKEAAEFKIHAILCYLGIFFIIALIVGKDSKFCKFHVNQGIVLFILVLIGSVISTVLSFVLAVIGLGFIGWLLSSVVGLYALANLVYAAININQGKSKQLPIIGNIRILK